MRWSQIQIAGHGARYTKLVDTACSNEGQRDTAVEHNEKTSRDPFPGTHPVQLRKTKGTWSKRRVKKHAGN